MTDALLSVADLTDRTISSMRWRSQAECRKHPEVPFVADKFSTKQVAAAKAICAQCPVTAECLKWALDYGETGVWGGTSDLQRRRMNQSTMIRPGTVKHRIVQLLRQSPGQRWNGTGQDLATRLDVGTDVTHHAIRELVELDIVATDKGLNGRIVAIRLVAE
jgi:WhiB family redox-sensing transcriptional regulator